MLKDFVQEHSSLPTAAYPIRGFIHFLRHPRRHAGPIFISIIKVIATSSLFVIPLYKYGYRFQNSLLVKIYNSLFLSNGFSSSIKSNILINITSLLLCFIETSAITLQISSHFVGDIRARLFDSVLKERNGLPTTTKSKGDDVAVISEKVSGINSSSSSHQRNLQQHPYRHFLSPYNIMIMSAQQDDSWSIFFLRSALFVLTLPLNVVPILGPLSFISIQALFRGGMAHRRYFQLYNWTPEQRQHRIETYFWQYQRFGLVATVMEMIPIAGYVFMYTNQIGAAMWAMDLHDKKLLEPKKE
ncbi:uncharacterized protein BX663DRAFT_483932 [Cokeromyces recurvatus]|uniref:uncharacterized protein n=1 Tax=Cokeromyces recurvatus TaxID=90255 RepID=UPI00222080FD|nr:uncharacterized protein BX663DRAFT_483932 [Cokeromyces recurvatus]KAI7905413.1 hypothetical protein BX663DRAFT_483932 [Cokeromyces recurvatus]